MKTLRNLKKNTNRSRINIYEQEIREFHEESKYTIRQINNILLKIQRTNRKDK